MTDKKNNARRAGVRFYLSEKSSPILNKLVQNFPKFEVQKRVMQLINLGVLELLSKPELMISFGYSPEEIKFLAEIKAEILPNKTERLVNNSINNSKSIEPKSAINHPIIDHNNTNVISENNTKIETIKSPLDISIDNKEPKEIDTISNTEKIEVRPRAEQNNMPKDIANNTVNQRKPVALNLTKLQNNTLFNSFDN